MIECTTKDGNNDNVDDVDNLVDSVGGNKKQ